MGRSCAYSDSFLIAQRTYSICGKLREIIGIRTLAALLCLSMSSMSNSANAQGVGAPISVGEIIVSADAAIRPWGVSVSPDGGIVSVGAISATRQGIAVKVDQTGREVWRYYRDLLDEDKGGLSATFGIGPEFHGAVGLSDGSTFLCGTQQRPLGKQSLGVVVHLSPSGTVIKDWLFSPEGHGDKGQPHLYKCVEWNGSLLFLGSVGRFYWIFATDFNGEKIWERVIAAIPEGVDPTVAFEGFIALPRSQDLIFSATDNRATEVLRLGSIGQVLAQKLWIGRFLICTPTKGEGAIKLFGSAGAASESPRELISIDDSLAEIRKVSSSNLEPVAVSGVFQLEDESLVVMGSGIHQFLSPRLRATVTHIDRGIERQRILELDAHGLFDAGAVGASTSLGASGRFVTVRSISVPASKPNSERDVDLMKAGEILNIIQLSR